MQEFCDYKREGLYTIDLLKKEKSARHWGFDGPNYSVLNSWKKVPDNWAELSKFKNGGFQYLSIQDFPEYKDNNELKDISFADLNSLVGSEVVELINKKLFDCIVWKYSEANLLPGRIDIESFKADPATCEPLKNIFYLANHNEISKTITDAQGKSNGLKNLLRRLSENSTRHLRKVWPEYGKIKIALTQNGEVIEAGIEDEFNVYSFDRRSDGFKRFVTFLLLISAKAKAEYLYDSLIIIDEPDLGLHLSGIQSLRKELEKVAKDNYIVVATHSIFMIDKDRIDRHIIVKKEKEETIVVSDYSSDMLDEEVIYRALGYSLFELLKKQNVIFEGWSDKHAFQLWLKSRRASNEIRDKWKKTGMIYALGAKDVQRVASNLESFDRDCVIVTDSDSISKEYQQKYEGKYSWYTYSDLGFADKETIEDFIEESYIVKKIQKVLKRELLDDQINISSNTTFNAKMAQVVNGICSGKKERERVKRMIKNEIHEDLDAKKIELGNLVTKINF